MADTIKTSSELKLTCLFDDDDTRILSFDNPKNDISKDTILDIQNDMVTNQPIIGDKTGAAFVKFTKARIINKSIIHMKFT